MNTRVKQLAFFISLACLSTPYSLIADTSTKALDATSKADPTLPVITYLARDSQHNLASLDHTFKASTDTTPPLVTLNGDNPLTLVQGTSFNDPGVTASDDSGLKVHISTSGRVNTNLIGTYTITYIVRDKAGNTTTVKRTVLVVKSTPSDTTAPVISLNGSNPVELTQGTAYTDAGATATDDVDGTVSVTTSGTVDVNTVGTYTLTYTATDAAGNTATATRTVVVKEAANVAPTANAGTPQTINENTLVTLDGTASTDTDGSIVAYAWTQVSGPAVELSNANTSQATFTAPEVTAETLLTFKLVVTDNKGATAESTTTVTVKNIINETPIATGILNDTGITQCNNGSANVLCPVTNYPNQDAQTGRDFTDNNDTDGHAGFSFTKLDTNGQALPDQTVDYATTPWACVKDNVTGFIWEVKTKDQSLHDVSWTYSWYEPNLPNGGDAGMQNGGSCGDQGSCDSSSYVARVNAQTLCGASDWRMPNVEELLGILSLDRQPAIDTNYFPNNPSEYWTSEHFVTGSFETYYATAIDMMSGNPIGWMYKSISYPVVLVRGQ